MDRPDPAAGGGSDPDPDSRAAREPTATRARSRWTRARARRVARRDELVAPVIVPPERDASDEVHLWDSWPVRAPDGSVALLDGYRVVVSLTAPKELLPGKRHDVARLRYFYSPDGREWHDGGPLFDGGALGSRQWAGCAMADGADLHVYYTAAGERGEAELGYSQRIAVATGGVARGGAGLRIEGPWRHETVLAPDGRRYETGAQSRGMLYTFRDPWFFRDGGDTYLLFEANVPVPEGSVAPDDPAGEAFNGCVGLAESPTGDPTEFRLRDPLLDAVRVNQELERPHVVVRDGRYYLFVSSHEHTFAPGLRGYDGLYGFVADSLLGEYEPLNGSGLVLTNPADAPFQAYSWLVYPHREELLVTSFFNYYDLRGRTLDDVADLPPDEQRRRFGGTFAPTVRVALENDRTRVVGHLDHGHLPLPGEPLPDRVPIPTPSPDRPARQDSPAPGGAPGADPGRGPGSYLPAGPASGVPVPPDADAPHE